jgi:F1F0 ATPase subunit 2
MSETWTLVLALIAGGALGAVFFGGLWWTVHRGLSSPRPALWFLVSLLVRTGLVVGGMLFVSGGRLDRLLLCLVGFGMARFAVTRLTRVPEGERPVDAREAGHAS